MITNCFDVNEYLRNTSGETVRDRVRFSDGFTVSIQASWGHYCSPRPELYAPDFDEYESVELGFPSAEDELINEYAENPESPTETVYGYVPVAIVNQLIIKHGGIV